MFDRITRAVTVWAGSPAAVIGSVLIVLVWALTGPLFRFSDTRQLVINTGTTILTFNMVFVIQAAQNRDGRPFKPSWMRSSAQSRARTIG